MRATFLALGIIIGGFLWGNAQEVLSSYKYVIVPTKFDNFRKENQYQTSTLIKYLLVQNGLNTVYDDALPPDLFANRCLGLTSILIDESNMFTTRVHIAFQDCNEVEVYRTQTGISKSKDFKEAFSETITESLQSLNGYSHNYKPAEAGSSITVSFDDDVKTLEPDPVASENIEGKVPEVPVIKEIPSVQAKEEVAVTTTAVAIQENSAAEKELVPMKSDDIETSLWYAQEIPNGFQLVDSSPQVRLRIYQTKKRGIYLAKSEEHEGIVYEEQGSWFFDYYQDGNLVHKTLNIKF